MDCSSITDFQQSTAIRIAKKFRNLHIGKIDNQHCQKKRQGHMNRKSMLTRDTRDKQEVGKAVFGGHG